MKKKLILAFSGGLDTLFCALYLVKQGFSVVTMTVDTGGFNSKQISQLEKSSKKAGVVKHLFVDGKEELYEYFSYVIKGNILRGGVYPLCVGLERLVIAAEMAKLADQEKAAYLAHGSTGAGSDQIRLGLALKILCPKAKIMAPVRDTGITRDKEIAFLKKNKVDFDKVSQKYSVNQGLIGTTFSGSDTNDSWKAPSEEAFPSVVPILQTTDKGDEIEISFQKGLPVSVNGKNMKSVVLMQFLNKIGAVNGIGKGLHLGDTIIGIKGRIAFEAPGALILIKAHSELEKLVLTAEQLFWKEIICKVYGNKLHEGLYFEPLMRNIESFIDSSQQIVTGKVKVKLQKGNILVLGCQSPYSLIRPEIAVYAERNNYWNGRDAEGFAKIYGLQTVLSNLTKERK